MSEPMTPGRLIDVLVRWKHQQQKEEEGGIQGLTEYTEKVLSDKSGLSKRKIDRLRQTDYFPAADAVSSLVGPLPDIEVLNPENICHRLLNPFENIQNDQDWLTDHIDKIEGKSKITIVAGWQKPQGLVSDDIARSIAKNISKGMIYEFIYPPLDTYKEGERKALETLNKWLISLTIKVKTMWSFYESSKIVDSNNIIESIKNKNKDSKLSVLDKVIKNMTFKISNQKDKSYLTQFWLLMPSPYCVLYNLGKDHSNNQSKYGCFLTDGILLRKDKNISEKDKFINNNTPIVSKGWLYMNDKTYNDIEIEYSQSEWKDIQVSNDIKNSIKNL